MLFMKDCPHKNIQALLPEAIYGLYEADFKTDFTTCTLVLYIDTVLTLYHKPKL